MIRVQLDEPEATALREALESYISDMRMEIADTDSLDFRNQIRRRKEALLSVLRQLPDLAQPGRPPAEAPRER